jgi:hypothetical protein
MYLLPRFTASNRSEVRVSVLQGTIHSPDVKRLNVNEDEPNVSTENLRYAGQ